MKLGKVFKTYLSFMIKKSNEVSKKKLYTYGNIIIDAITQFDNSLYLQQGQAKNHDDDENHVLIKKCVIGRQKELGSSQMRGSPSSPMYPAHTAAQLLPAIAH